MYRSLLVLAFGAGLTGCFEDAMPVPTEGGETETTGNDTSPSDPTTAGGSTSTGADQTTGGDATASSDADDESSEAGGETTGETGDGVDVTPPTIESFSPADGSMGVPEDTRVVITFSEPMDQATTEAAYASEQLPPASVSMQWDSTGTVLTIEPDEPLPHSSGTDPLDVDPLLLALTIETGATDIAGNPLDESATVSFSAPREITQSLGLNAPRTGNVREDGLANNCFALPVPCAGDSGQLPNAQYRGFFSVDLALLPDGIVEIESATLATSQTQLVGTPYVALGSVAMHHVSFDTLDLDAFEAPSLLALGAFSDDAELEGRTIDITDPLNADYVAGNSFTQYMIEFTTATDGNGGADSAAFDENFTTTVTYRIP